MERHVQISERSALSPWEDPLDYAEDGMPEAGFENLLQLVI
jgi:hypothetical protein